MIVDEHTCPLFNLVSLPNSSWTGNALCVTSTKEGLRCKREMTFGILTFTVLVWRLLSARPCQNGTSTSFWMEKSYPGTTVGRNMLVLGWIEPLLKLERCGWKRRDYWKSVIWICILESQTRMSCLPVPNNLRKTQVWAGIAGSNMYYLMFCTWMDRVLMRCCHLHSGATSRII